MGYDSPVKAQSVIPYTLYTEEENTIDTDSFPDVQFFKSDNIPLFFACFHETLELKDTYKINTTCSFNFSFSENLG